MEEKLAKIYSQLGNHIVSMIPVEWSKIYYLGEVGDEKSHWSSVFYFYCADNNQIIRSHDMLEIYNISMGIYNELLDEADSYLLEIYDCFQEYEQELWNQLSFTIDKSGKFNIDYIYNISVDDDQVKREVVWAYETFGFMHEEGSYFRGVLDEYLRNKG